MILSFIQMRAVLSQQEISVDCSLQVSHVKIDPKLIWKSINLEQDRKINLTESQTDLVAPRGVCTYFACGLRFQKKKKAQSLCKKYRYVSYRRMVCHFSLQIYHLPRLSQQIPRNQLPGRDDGSNFDVSTTMHHRRNLQMPKYEYYFTSISC